jgi:hypothetical protein
VLAKVKNCIVELKKCLNKELASKDGILEMEMLVYDLVF